MKSLRGLLAGGVLAALLAAAGVPAAAATAEPAAPAAPPSAEAATTPDGPAPGAAAAAIAAVVLPSSAESAMPDVAWDGTNYLVVWEDYRTGDGDIYGAQVSPNGTVLSVFVVYEDVSYDDIKPVVAFNGTNFLVAWQRTYAGGSTDQYAVRVAKNATVVGTPIFVGYGSSASGSARLAALGSVWLVVWEDNGSIYANRISGSGVKLDGYWGFSVSTSAFVQRAPTVFTHQGRWVVAWHEFRTGTADVYYTMATNTGVVSNPLGLQVTSNAGDDYGVSGRSVGNVALLSWTNGGNIRGARIDSAFGLVGALDGFAIATGVAAQRQSSVAPLSSTQWVVVWSEKATTWDIRSRTVSTLAALGPVQLVTTAAGDQIYPAVARGATNALTVWQDGRAASTRGNDIYGRLLTSTALPTGTDIAVG